jgi:type II secretory pathway predicted ATPase ExeA
VSISAVDTGPELIASMEWAYEGYWGLAARPFDNVPDPRFYVPSAQHEAAKQRILYGIHRRKGIVMLTGEIGSGKTLMSRALILTLPDSRYDVALVANPSMPEEEFLGEILFQFGAASGGSKAEQLRRLNDRLLANHQSGLDTILVVDEAQAIRHDTVFEGLRLLSNFQLNDRVLLTLVLLGQPELRARITQIPQLAQRVAIQAHHPCRDEGLCGGTPRFGRVHPRHFFVRGVGADLRGDRGRVPADQCAVRRVSLRGAPGQRPPHRPPSGESCERRVAGAT